MKSIIRAGNTFLAVAIGALSFGRAIPSEAGVTLGNEVFVGASAHAEGSNNSFFATDVRVFNPGPSGATVQISYLPGGQDNSAVTPVSKSVGAGETLALDDIVDSLFKAAGAGGLRFVSDHPVAVTSRTYNRTTAGTFSQFIPARSPAEALATGTVASIIQLDKTTAFRSNTGFLNVTSGGASVHLDLYDGAGVLLGVTDVGVPPYGFSQIDPFANAGLSSATNARVSATVTSGTVIAYASVIDSSTNDPNYIEPAITRLGDRTVWGETVVSGPTTTFRGYLELTVVSGVIGQIKAWDQVYETISSSTGQACFGVVDLDTVAGIDASIGADGSFSVPLSGAFVNGTLTGTLQADGSGSGAFSITTTGGGCAGSFTGTWSGGRK